MPLTAVEPMSRDEENADLFVSFNYAMLHMGREDRRLVGDQLKVAGRAHHVVHLVVRNGVTHGLVRFTGRVSARVYVALPGVPFA